jgi:hypothetical protein
LRNTLQRSATINGREIHTNDHNNIYSFAKNCARNVGHARKEFLTAIPLRVAQSPTTVNLLGVRRNLLQDLQKDK